MPVRISELPSVAAADGGDRLPISRAGQSARLTVQQIADLARTQISDDAPAALDTLKELSAALSDDADFAATMTTALAGKLAADGSVDWGGDQNANGQSIVGLDEINGRAIATLQSRMGDITVVADGAAIPATDGFFANMTGSSCYLPDTGGLPTGFTVYVFAPQAGAYTAHKALWIAAQAGQNIYSYGANVLAQTLYLVPGEFLRVTLTSGGYWIWEQMQGGHAPRLCAGNPSASWASVPTAVTSFNYNDPVTAWTSVSGGSLVLPWHGRYAFEARLQVSRNTSDAYVYLFGVDETNQPTALTEYSRAFKLVTSGIGTDQLVARWEAYCRTDSWAGAQFNASVGGAQYLPSASFLNARFLGR